MKKNLEMVIYLIDIFGIYIYYIYTYNLNLNPQYLEFIIRFFNIVLYILDIIVYENVINIKLINVRYI